MNRQPKGWNSCPSVPEVATSFRNPNIQSTGSTERDRLVDEPGIHQIDIIAADAVAVVVDDDSQQRSVRRAVKASVDVPKTVSAGQQRCLAQEPLVEIDLHTRGTAAFRGIVYAHTADEPPGARP